jgi:hypothetical protein
VQIKQAFRVIEEKQYRGAAERIVFFLEVVQTIVLENA